TTPEVSSDRSAPLTARSEPIASIFGCHSLVPAVEAEMVCGGLLSAPMNFLFITALNAPDPKIPPHTTTTATSTITNRLISYSTPVAAGVRFGACTVWRPAMGSAEDRKRAERTAAVRWEPVQGGGLSFAKVRQRSAGRSPSNRAFCWPHGGIRANARRICP